MKQNKNKIFWYVVAIAFVLVMLMVTRGMKKNKGISEETKETNKATTEQQLSTEEETAQLEKDPLTEGFLVGEPHMLSRQEELDQLVYLKTDLQYYSFKGEKDTGAIAIDEAIANYLKSLEKEVNAFSKKAKSYYEDYISTEGEEGFKPYEYKVSTKLLRNDRSVVSMIVYTYRYEGGSHGDVVSYCLNFDSVTGKQLSLTDLLSPLSSVSKDAWRQEFVERIVDQCQEKKDLKDDYETIVAGQLVEDGRWALTAEGIQFVADTYVLAPYSAGMLVFTIPTEEITWFETAYAFEDK